MSRAVIVVASMLLGGAILSQRAAAQEVARSESVTVRAGQTQRIAFYPAAKRDCTRTPLPEINLLDEPRNGRVIVRRTNIVAAPGSACPGQTIPGLLVTYTAKPNASGQDRARYAIRLSGRSATVQVNIRIMGGMRAPRDGVDI